jgi:hypothetical protein
MPAIFENINCTSLLEGERRNTVASVLAGSLFFIGWWIILDVAAAGHPTFYAAYYICGVLGTIALFMINVISNGQLRGDAFTEGCLGPRGSRTWLFIGFVLGFGAVIASGWILFGGYVLRSDVTDKWPGTAVFLQNFCIFLSALVYKFGRSEDLWG